MKLKCPTCGKTYDDGATAFCWADGAALIQSDDVPTVFYNPPVSQPTLQSQQNHTPQTENFPQMPPPAAKKSNWMIYAGIGVVALVALLGIGGLLLLFYAMSIVDQQNSNAAAKNSNKIVNPDIQQKVSDSEKYKPELMMAINGANDAQSLAYVNYDTDILKKYYSGEALKYMLAQTESLKKQKIYHSSKMEAQKFEYFKVNDDGTQAEVKVTETWTTTAYAYPSGKCLAAYPATETPQIVYLKKNAQGWLVDSNIYDVGTRVDPQPCPKGQK